MTVTVSRVLPNRRLRRQRQVPPDRNILIARPAYPSWPTVIGQTLRRHAKDAFVVLVTAGFLVAVVAGGFWLLTVRS
jgi:hypothetical protein